MLHQIKDMSLCPYRKGKQHKLNTNMNNVIKYSTATEFHEGCYQLTMAGAAFHADGSSLIITITGY